MTSERREPDASRETSDVPDSIGAAIKEGVKEGLIEEASSSLKWAGWGALIGAVALGLAGLIQFNPTIGAIGAALGAVVGGIGAWVFYLQATSLT